MPQRYLLKAVDFLLTSSKLDLQYHFFGGEPLIAPFERIEKTILYGERQMKKLKRKIQFIITTNGILLDEKKIKFFRDHDVFLELSLDGKQESQDKNRPQVGGGSSYKLIVKKLPLLFKSGIKNSCSMVVSPLTVDELVENFLHLVDLGFKKIFIMIACCMDWERECLKSLKENLTKLLEIYPNLLIQKRVILLNLKEWYSPFRMNTELAVDFDGKIYSACVTYLIPDHQIRKKFVLGHILKVKTSIDRMENKRLSNEAAMKIIFKTRNILHLLPNNIAAGEIMTDFCFNLYQKLKNKNLLSLYEKYFQTF